MKRKFYIWDNGDKSVGINPTSHVVNFEIEDFDEKDFDEDNQKYLKEEIDNMIIDFLRDNQDFFSEFHLHIMTEDEHYKLMKCEEELEKQFDKNIKESDNG
jgi:hypothetical protein